MSYKVTEEGNISTVHLDGEIDMDVTEKAKEVIFPVIDSGKEVHLNLSQVQYMDSSGTVSYTHLTLPTIYSV